MAAKWALNHLPPPLREPIAPALVAAIAVHALLLLAVGFGFELPQFKTNTLAVTVALMPATLAPDNARHVAAENQQGLDTPGEQAAPQMVMQTTMTLSRELDGGDGELSADQVTAEAIERQLQELEQ